MKLGDFLNTLARKCNIENDPHLVSFLSNAENANREIADEFVNSIDTNLMSLEGAKNNPAVLNHYKPIILKAVDDKFAVIAEKYGFSDDLLNEKSSYKKFDILESRIEKKIAEIEAKQGKTGDKEKEAKLTEQLNELTGKLQQITQQKETEVKAIETRYEGEITEMQVKNSLASKKYSHKDLSSDVNISVARHLLNEQLKAQGAMLVRKDGELRLVQAANPEMDFVDTGFKKVSFADFTNKVLAENKLLDVSTGDTTPKTVTQHQTQPIIPTQPNVNTSKFDAAAQAAMESIATTE